MAKTMIYKVPGQHRGPRGTTYSYRGAEVGDDIPEGWHDSLEGAVNAHFDPVEKPKRKRRTKAEMEAAKEQSGE